MAPPHPAGPGAQYAQQFLSTALSQRGPSALPYAEDSKWLIRHHLVALSDAFPSLHPKTSTFTHNDGRQSHLLQADGTIPILFAGSPYNIPASIWLLESYPRLPPAVFLSPTRDMVVKPHHPYVDRSGSVDVPYLRSWIFPSSNLVDLVQSLSHLFSQDPPLYTRPNPNPNPPPRSYMPSSSSMSSLTSQSPYGGRLAQTPPPARPAEDAAEVYRRNAISKIVDSVHSDTAGLRKSREAEMEALFSTQTTLRQRADELARGLREMDGEREGLEQQLQVVSVDVDEVFEPADAMSRQLLECTAADLAIEDTIYALDKAVQEGAIPFDMYLKNVRMLAREQFFHRALSAKVRAVQVQAQVASMAARAPLYSS